MINFEQNNNRYVSSLIWDFLPKSKVSTKDIESLIKGKSSVHAIGIKNIVGIERTHASVGFVTDDIMDEVNSLKNTFSLASILAGDYFNCIGFFEIYDQAYFIAVSDGAVVPDTDIVFDINDDSQIKDIQAIIDDVVVGLFDNIASPKFITNKPDLFESMQRDSLDVTEIDLFLYLDNKADKRHSLQTLKGLSPAHKKGAMAIAAIITLASVIAMIYSNKKTVIKPEKTGPTISQKNAQDAKIMEKSLAEKSKLYLEKKLGTNTVKWIDKAYKKARFIPRHVAGYRYQHFICLNQGECETFWRATRTADPVLFAKEMEKYEATTGVRFSLDGMSAAKVITYHPDEQREYSTTDFFMLKSSKSMMDLLVIKARKATRLDYHLSWEIDEPKKAIVYAEKIKNSSLPVTKGEVFENKFSIKSVTSHSLPSVTSLFDDKNIGFSAMSVTINNDHSINWEVEGIVISAIDRELKKSEKNVDKKRRSTAAKIKNQLNK